MPTITTQPLVTSVIDGGNTFFNYCSYIRVEGASNGVYGNSSSNSSLYNIGSYPIVSHLGARYELAIPKYAVLSNATLTFRADSNSGTTAGTQVTLAVENQRNPDLWPFLGSSSRFTDSANHVGQTLWTPGQWTAGQTYTTPSFHTQLQTIINDSGWLSGDKVAVYATANMNTATNILWVYSNATADRVILSVTYTMPSGFNHLDCKDGEIVEVGAISGNYLIRNPSGGLIRKSGVEVAGALILDNGIIKEKA